MSNGAILFIVIVFATVFLLSQGMIVPVFGESRKARKRLKQRLGDLEQETGGESFSSLLREKYLRELSDWERALEQLPAMESLSATIEQAGHSMLAHRLCLLACVLGAAGGFGAWTFSHQPLLTLVGVAIGGALPFMKIFKDRTKRIQKIEEQLPEAIDMIKRALRAGHPFSGAIKLVSEEMPEPTAKEFRTTFADLNYGNDVRRAMLGLLQRIPSVPVMAVVTSVLVQKETGGNLAEILEQISAVIRGRFRLERKVRTLSAEGRLSTWVLALVPLVLFAVIWVTTPDYLPTLVEDSFGQKLVAYGLGSAVVGVFWIRKIIRIDVEEIAMDMTTMAFAAMIGLAVCLLAAGIATIVSSATDPVRRRVVAATRADVPERTWSIDLSRFVTPVAKYVLPSKSDERNSAKLSLIQAGFRSPNAVVQFYGVKTLLALGLPLVTYLGVRWLPQMTMSMILFAVVLAAFIGMRLPDMALGNIRKRRIKRLRNGFPDALDLLVVCVESGLGLTPAIERVAREIEISHADLAEELALVNAEIRAGVERATALRNLARRSGVEDINGLVGLLVQTIRFGTSVADALRVYSEEFRDKRMQKAEEQAAKIGTKMIFPMVTCFFPSFFIVAIGPAVMRIVAAFQSMG